MARDYARNDLLEELPVNVPEYERIPHEASNRIHALHSAAVWLSSVGSTGDPHAVVDAARVFERFLNE